MFDRKLKSIWDFEQLTSHTDYPIVVSAFVA